MSRAKLWNRNLALLWQGQFVSSLGKNVFHLTAILWLKDATGSGTLAGLLGGLAMLPMVVLGPFSGVFVDRVDRGKMIAWTDIAGGLLVALAAALFFAFGSDPGALPWLIAAVFAVATGTGLLDSFSQPSISASIPEIVPRERLEAANGLNMAGIHGAVLAAQGLAGILYVTIGAPLLIAWNALTYLWAGITELWIRTPPLPERAKRADEHPFRRFLRELAEGARYVWRNRGLKAALIVFTLMNFLISPLLGLLAFLVQDHMGLGKEWLGYLMALFAGGGILGFLAGGAIKVKGPARLWGVTLAFIVQSGLVLLMLAFTAWYLEMAWVFLAGLLGGFGNVHTGTLIQTAAPTELRGRVSSIGLSLSMGAMPLGMAISGVFWDITGGKAWLVVGAPVIVLIITNLAALASRDYREFFIGDGKKRPSLDSQRQNDPQPEQLNQSRFIGNADR